MNCPDCEDRLIDYASAELADPARVAVSRHLAGCSACALSYCRLQADLDGIVEAHAEAPRARVFHRLRRKVAAEHGPPWWTRPHRWLAQPVPMYGAVLACLLPVALWMVSTMGRPQIAAPTPSATPAPASLIHYDATQLPPTHDDVL